MTSRESPIRRLAESTRRNLGALTPRVSPEGAVRLADRLSANRALQGLGDFGVGSVTFPEAEAAITGGPYTFGGPGMWRGPVTVNRGGLRQDAGRRVPTLEQYGQIGRFYEGTLPGYEAPSGITFPDAEAALGRITGGAPLTPEFDPSGLYAAIDNQIATALAQRELAIEEGKADVAAEFDEEIARLNDAKAKLLLGRSNINARYEQQQSFLAEQRAQVGRQELAATGTDIEEEVANVRRFYSTGADGIDSYLETIAAGSPALAQQLSGEVKRFQGLAESALRSDLQNQANVLQAASLFAQRAGDLAVAQGAADAEAARFQVESDLTKQINDLAERVQQLQDDKADALKRLEDSIPEYDSRWLQDEEAVWGVLMDQYFAGKDYTFEQRAELINQFEDMYFGLPTAQRTPEGMRQWAEENMASLNLSAMLDLFGARDPEDFRNRRAQLFIDQATAEGIYLTTEEALLQADEDLNRMVAFASNPNLTEASIAWLEAWTGQEFTLDLLTMEDYELLFEIGDLRHDFVNGGYDEFVSNATAGIAGRGFAGAVDGSTLTRSDMEKYTGTSGSIAYLHPGAMPSFIEMVEAAAKEGIHLQWSDTYRSWSSQMKYYQDFHNPAHPNFGRNANGEEVPNIAHPDSSNHPRGLAVDFTMNPGVYDWLKENADRFGWGGISNEDWHWEYRGNLVPTSDTPTAVQIARPRSTGVRRY